MAERAANGKPILRDFDSHKFADVGENPEAWSGANNFNFPQEEIPPEPGKGDCTHQATEAFFSQPRRRG